MAKNSEIIIRGGTIILVGNKDGGNANEKAETLDIINIHPGTKIDDIKYDGTNNDQWISYIKKGKVVSCYDSNRGDSVRHGCDLLFFPEGGGPPIIFQVNSTIDGFIDAVLFLNLEIPTPGCDLLNLPDEMTIQGLSVQRKREKIIPALKYLSVQVKNT